MTGVVGKAWPFEEAAKLVERYKKNPPEKGYALFETGYGPSGLPHIGTFGEVARTQMVRHAFSQMCDIPTRLICFSDDMDGFRKVPENVPEREMLAQYIGKPLTRVPDPFGTHDSFGAHNNARLRAFLDGFGFEYEFLSATECYTSGMFDATLLNILKHYDAVTNVILPTLGDERRETYSPFLPLCPKTGRVLQAKVIATDVAAGTITYINDDGDEVTTTVTGGAVKCQWKADWAMRWAALGVDYEMKGKDLTPSVVLSSQICKILGSPAPEGFAYELFLDDKGQKISKSKGNGLTIEEWLAYAPQESLALYMFQQPRKAKRLYFDVIPKAVDEYLTFSSKYQEQDDTLRVENPAWHIHSGNPPKLEVAGLSFGLLLNLASACNPEDKSVLWGFISNYAKDATPETCPMLDHLAEFAVKYYHDFVKPEKKYRAADDKERAALLELQGVLENWTSEPDAESLQTEIYRIGTEHGFEPLRAWFSCMYEVLLGSTQGPRMGSFAALYGVKETAALIQRMLV
jgi:lysyl-tRNA synthetase class 1